MGTVTNTDRAGWARAGLAAYQASHRCDSAPAIDAQDLIGDLLHLVDEIVGEGHAEILLDQAWVSYAAEVDDEATE